jgi:hypothetical protein
VLFTNASITAAHYARTALQAHPDVPCAPRSRLSSARSARDSSRSRVRWRLASENPFRDRHCAGSDATSRARFYFAFRRPLIFRFSCSCVGVEHCAAKGGRLRAPHARPPRAA